MTTQFCNRIIIVGRLDGMFRKGKARGAVSNRNAIGGYEKEFAVQIVTALGQAFSLPLHVAGRASGSELLNDNHIGQPIVIEGELQRVLWFDRRFANADNPAGLPVRETQIRVHTIREPREDEPFDTTAVWLMGEILNAPNVVRSQANPALQLATMVMQTTIERPSAYPGSRAVIRETADVNISVPVGLPNANALFRVGNIALVEGQLDCLLVPQQGEMVDRKLNDLEQAWQAQRQILASQNPDQVAAANREYQRNRERLRLAPRISVLVSFIEPASGEPLELTEAVKERRNKRRMPQQELVASLPAAVEELNGHLEEV
jgi:hypothetical protein